MRYLLLLSFFILFPILAQAEEGDADAQSQVYCECEHVAGVLQEPANETTINQCVELIPDLVETYLGAFRVPCDENSCTCILTHSVYGVGDDRDSAIENAILSCSDVSEETGREFNIISVDECKDES